jgi:hypothetical protein
VRIGGGRNCLTIVSNGKLWYQGCRTSGLGHHSSTKAKAIAENTIAISFTSVCGHFRSPNKRSVNQARFLKSFKVHPILTSLNRPRRLYFFSRELTTIRNYYTIINDNFIKTQSKNFNRDTETYEAFRVDKTKDTRRRNTDRHGLPRAGFCF